MFRNLLVRFWSDESGAVIAIEYLLLGSIVAAGGVTGMTSIRDSMTDEYREMGNTVRETRQQATKPGAKTGSATTGGTVVSNVAGGVTGTAPVQGNLSIPPTQPATAPALPATVSQVTFACP